MAAAGTMSAAALQDYHTKRHTSGVDMDDEALVQALRDVKSESRTNWMACTYDANNSQALRLLASGEGGFLELIESLTDILVVYGCFMAVYEGQSKCVFVTWVGPDVSPMTRARVSMHKSDVMNWFQPVVSFDVDEREGLNLCSDVIAKIKGKLSSLGEKEIFLNSNEAHGAASSSAEAVLSQSEWDPLPALAASVASAASEDEVALLTKALVATGLGERAAASFASEVSPPLVGEVRAVAAALQDCTAAAAGSAVALSMEEGGGEETSSEEPPPATTEPPAPTEGAASVASFVGRLLPQIWRKNSAAAVAGEQGGERAASGDAEMVERLAPLRGRGLRLSLCLVLRAHLAVRKGDWAVEFAKLALPLLVQGVARLAEEQPDWLHSRSQAAKATRCTPTGSCHASARSNSSHRSSSHRDTDASPPSRCRRSPAHLINAHGTATDGTATYGTPTYGTATYGTATDGTATDGTPTYGTPTYGTATYGTATDGTATDGAPTYGAPTYGTPTYGAPTYGTATDGTATDGTATDGTATDGAPTYGAPTYGAPTYGAPTYGTATDGTATDGTATDGTPSDGAASRRATSDNYRSNATATASRSSTWRPETSADAEEVTIERRQLFWKKIVQPARLADSVFGELEGVLDSVKQSVGQQLEAEVSSLFTRKKVAQQLTEAERIGQEVGAIGGVLKAGSLTFLDQQRFNNIAIPLTQLGLDNRVIRDAVVAMDASVLTPPVVSLLMDCAPTADDVEAISFYDGDPALLAQVERFFWEVHKVPLFSKRLAALHASHGFTAQALGVQKLLETVSSAMAQLQCSSGFEMVLALLLLAGNAMNSGGVRGDACAFDLEVLTKLADVRSMHRGVAGRSHSLLQMLVALAEERLPDTAARWVEQLSAMDEACRIPFSRIFAELAELTKAVKLVEAVHTAASKLKPPAGAPVDPFVRVMGAWLEQSTAITNDLRRQLQQATRVYAACARRLCVDAAEGPEVLFGRLAAFASQWKAARAANHAAAARVAREEWLAKQKQEG
ncbi:hypothetical protein AB1Y20_000573 [Prymnesium parvum]|uniref:Formin-like protein n=1 Tax=Prymnesium parvum TaxID=97485 RepID=A0AB34K9F9_PRYPA